MIIRPSLKSRQHHVSRINLGLSREIWKLILIRNRAASIHLSEDTCLFHTEYRPNTSHFNAKNAGENNWKKRNKR